MKKEIRMLAAIMFTDMVGYTVMMQENERKAKALRDRHREVLQNLILEHNGQILQYYGDGTLAIFGSAIEATICGARIQQELQRDPKVPLRIGIHAGDIVYDDEGIYGDGVNVASRIENLALPGSVLVSDKVNEELKNQTDVSTLELGIFNLKNVRYPLRVYSVSSHGITVPTPDQVAGKIKTAEHSIAVLPFVNMSADKENEYFSDGITEEILNTLARVDGLMVTSRTSAFAFKGKNEDIRVIGKQLGVKNVLEGSVRKHGNKVRITAQLISVEDGYHKWSEVYDRNLEDIFAVQDEIANHISANFQKTITLGKKAETLVKSPTDNMEAYNLHLKAKFYWSKWTPADVRRSMEFSERAFELDPHFALPYSGLSSGYVYLGAIGQMPTKIAYPKAKENAIKALELDDTLAESHLSLAMVNFFYEWDWDAAQKRFIKATELNPNSVDAHQYYSMYLIAMGDYKKAINEAETALDLDPMSIPVNSALAGAYASANLLDQAREQFQKTLELDPHFREALNGLGWVYYKMGDTEKALDIFLKVQKLIGSEFKGTAFLGYIYARMGKIEEAKECLNKLKIRETEEKDISLHMDFAVLYIGLNDLDKAFERLDIAYEEKLGSLIFITNRHWKEIHNDPRYIDLLKRMGLPND